MKKSKILMPIIGIAAIGPSIVPLTALTSCSKGQSFKVELTKTTKEQQLYANSKTISLFFTQNDLTNYAKIRVRFANLKINGAEVSSVAGLLKLAVDSAGGMRVTINLATMLKHFSNPETIEFDLLFHNRATGAKYTVDGFKFNIDQDTEVPNPFTKEGTVLTGFNDEIEAKNFKMASFAQSYTDVFVQVTIPVTKATKIVVQNELEQKELYAEDEIVGMKEPEEFEEWEEDEEDTKEEKAKEEADATNIFYKMIIPASFTGIDEYAFVDQTSNISTIPDQIISVDFAANSKLTTIGKFAFEYSNLIYVTLPPSLDEIGEGCFNGTPRLMSLEFAPVQTSKKGLVIPGGMLYNSNISYIKLPNYITGIQTVTSGQRTIPAIDRSGAIPGNLYIDVTDFNPTQIQTLGAGTADSGAIGTTVNTYLVSPSSGISKVVEKYLSDKIDFYDEVLPYSCYIDDDVVELNILKKSGIIDIMKEQNTIGNSVLNGYVLPKLQLPNFFYDDDDEVFLPINSIYTTTGLINSENYISSVVLPNNLVAVNDATFTEWPYLHSISIPSTLKEIPAKGFADTPLNIINYGGTKDDWSNITLGSNWNLGCEAITVYCADGNKINIKANQEAQAA